MLDKRSRSNKYPDGHSTGSAFRFLLESVRTTTYDPIGAPIPLLKHSDTVLNGAQTSVSLHCSTTKLISNPRLPLPRPRPPHSLSPQYLLIHRPLPHHPQPLRHHLPHPRPITMQRDPLLLRKRRDLDELVLREDGPAQGVLERDEPGWRAVDVGGKGNGREDVVGEGKVVPVLGDDGVGGGLPVGRVKGSSAWVEVQYYFGGTDEKTAMPPASFCPIESKVLSAQHALRPAPLTSTHGVHMRPVIKQDTMRRLGHMRPDRDLYDAHHI